MIIGGGIAGLAAAASARKTDAKAEITVLSKEPYSPYRKASLPYVIQGTILRPNEIAMYPSPLLKPKKILLLRGFEAHGIYVNERTVTARNVKTKKEKAFSYDALVLAMGGSAFIPPIQGIEKESVYSFTTFKDAFEISQRIRVNENAVIVGAGPIGLKVGEALIKRKVNVTVVEKAYILYGHIEPSFSLSLKEQIKHRYLKMMTGVSPKGIGGKKAVEYVEVDEEKIPASVVIFATGVRPFVKLAEEAGIELGKYGVYIDDRMHTSVSEVYAAGDCAETLDFTTKKRTFIPAGSIAAQEGMIAGINAAGGDKRTGGFLRIEADNFFGTEITSMGHGSVMAKRLGIKVSVEDIKLPSAIGNRPYFAEKYPARVKVVADQKGKVIGVQVICHKWGAPNSYALLQAIKERMTIGELKELWKLPLASMADFSIMKTGYY